VIGRWGSMCLITVLPGHVQKVAAKGQASLPGQLLIVTDKGKTSKEQGNLVVKEAMCAMLHAWDAPFRWGALPKLSACAPDRPLIPSVLHHRALCGCARCGTQAGSERRVCALVTCLTALHGSPAGPHKWKSTIPIGIPGEPQSA
jgi:hypothetical protein